MKTVYDPQKSNSWLEWPVKLKGLADIYNPHITAKFFGKARIDPKVVERRCEASKPFVPWKALQFEWETKIWTGHDNEKYFVLLLTKYPTQMLELHKGFDLILDQFTPWQPHISVPKAYFFLVEDQAFLPYQCDLEVGDPVLYIGNRGDE